MRKSVILKLLNSLLTNLEMKSRMNTRLIQLVLALLVLVIINACKVGPNYKTPEPEIDSTAVYRYDSLQLAMTDSVLNVNWWELFQDPILDTLINIGLQENKDILIASARIEQAREQVGIAKADYWPKFGYQVGASRGSVLGGFLPTEDNSPQNVFTGFGTLNWELDFWGKFRRATESAKANLVASEYGKRTVQIGLISEIADTYYTLLDFRWRLDISRYTLNLRQESLEIIQERFDKGIVPEIDVNQAEIQRAIAAASVPLYQRRVAITENALRILLGRVPGPVMLGPDLYDQNMPPDIPVGLPSMLVNRRPDIRRAEALLHAQNAQIGVAVAQRFPSISLTGLLGVASNDISNLAPGGPAWSIGASMLGPLFEFGKNKRRVEVERYKTEQALREYELTVITAFKEVEDALVNISTLKEELTYRQDHVNAALSARNLSKERYDKGVTSFLELLESERQAFEAELSYARTMRRLFGAYTGLYKALGGGWLSEEEMQAYQSAESQDTGN
jgi:multidrug efflux system outer membrane protein